MFCVVLKQQTLTHLIITPRHLNTFLYSLLYCLLFVLFLFMLGSTECGRARRLNPLWSHIHPCPLGVQGWWRQGERSRAARFTGVCSIGWSGGGAEAASSDHCAPFLGAISSHCGCFVRGKIFRFVCWISGRLGHHLVKGGVWIWTRLQLKGRMKKKECIYKHLLSLANNTSLARFKAYLY